MIQAEPNNQQKILIVVVNQRNIIIRRKPATHTQTECRTPAPRDEVLASIFDTLLSSQASDTHHQPHPQPRARPPGQPFKLTRPRRSDQIRDPLVKSDQIEVRRSRRAPQPYPLRTSAPDRVRGGRSGLGRLVRISVRSPESRCGVIRRDRPTSLSIESIAVASVSPCRADEENSTGDRPDRQNGPSRPGSGPRTRAAAAPVTRPTLPS